MAPMTKSNRAPIPFKDRLYCSINEACEAIGVRRSKMFELKKSGAVESVIIGRRRMILVGSLLRLGGLQEAAPEKPGTPAGQAPIELTL
jgi:hypothetical protein